MTKNHPTNKVLIVDDDPFIMDMYVVKFRECGFAVDTAGDGKTALQKIVEFVPDIVLLDILLPGMTGFDILQQIKTKTYQSGHPPKVILLTNLGQKEDIDRGMELGADDYLIKAHFTPTEIAEKIIKFIS
jgi:DNA-binding response OmpR family regulator